MIAKLTTLARTNQKEFTRFIKFCVVGTLGAVIDFGVLNLLVQLAGFPKVLANACSFTAAVISNFIWNRLWVYPETRGEPLRRQFDGAIDLFTRELPTQAILDRGHAYLTPAVEGEAILSMGRVVEYAEHGFNGIVNIIPFGCMPGTIVGLLLHQFRQDYGLPVLTISVEGTKDTT